MAQPQQPDKKILHLPYFKRTQGFDNQLNTQVTYKYTYTLLGIARNNTTCLDIYDNYFLKRFNRQYYLKSNQTESPLNLKPYISRFLLWFIELIAIKSIPHMREGITLNQTKLFNEFFGSVQNIKQRRKSKKDHQIRQQDAFFNYLRQEVRANFQNERQRADKYSTPTELISFTMKELKKKLKEIEDELDNQVMFALIKQKQFVPKFSEERIKQYIIESYQKIINIDVFLNHTKYSLLKLFKDINIEFSDIKVFLLMQTKTKANKQEIGMQKYSKDKFLIASKMLKKCMQNFKQPDKKLQIQYQYIRNLVIFFNQYTSKTRHFYPNISINETYFDQKKLQIFESHHPLILDAIGMSKKTQSLELEIATKLTPSFEYQKCHLQMEEENIYKLMKRYYFPNQYYKKGEDKKEQLGQQKQNKLKSQIQDLTQLQENIHVWRLITILYYISNDGVEMTKELYDPYFSKMNNSSQLKKKNPFYFKSYKKIIKQIYQDINLKTNFLIELLPPLKFHLQSEFSTELKKKSQIQQLKRNKDKLFNDIFHQINLRQGKNEPFNFSLNSLCNLLNIDQEDSLVQTLKYVKFKNQFQFRYIVLKQISDLLFNQKFFKTFANAKKYILLILLYLLEDTYFEISIKRKMHKQLNFRKIIFYEFDKKEKQISLSEEKKKQQKNKRNFQNKIQEYRNRQRDVNILFLQRYPKYQQCINKANIIYKSIPNDNPYISLFLKRTPQQQFDRTSMSQQELELLAKTEREVNRFKFLSLLSIKIESKRDIIKRKRDILNLIILESSMFEKSSILQFLREISDKGQSQEIIRLYNEVRQQNRQSLVDDINQMIELRDQTCRRLSKKINDLLTQSEGQIEDLRKEWIVLKISEYQKLYKIVLRTLKIFIKDQIQSSVESLEKFHKKQEITTNSQQIYRLYNYKLLTILKIYACLDNSNWTKFQTLFYSLSLHFKGGSQINLRRFIENWSQDEIGVEIYSMEILRKIHVNDIFDAQDEFQKQSLVYNYVQAQENVDQNEYDEDDKKREEQMKIESINLQRQQKNFKRQQYINSASQIAQQIQEEYLKYCLSSFDSKAIDHKQ